MKRQKFQNYIIGMVVIVLCCFIPSHAFGEMTQDVLRMQNKAEQGNVAAQLLLALLYQGGGVVQQDNKRAFHWCQKAAEHGNSSAQDMLGRMYFIGEGVKQDKEQAFQWYLKSSEQGFAGAQLNLGNIYFYGAGVKRDRIAAYAWWSLAAMGGVDAGGNKKERLGKQLSLEDLKLGKELTLQLREKVANRKLGN